MVNSEGARTALAIHYDRTAVAHWLAGTRPREQVCVLICQVLSRALGRTIHPAQAGFAEAVDTPPAASPQDRLRELAEDTPTALRALQRLPYSLTSELSLPKQATGAEPRSGRIGIGHAKAAELMVVLFAKSDLIFGGARLRPALAAHLSTEIAPSLECSATPSIAQRFRQASADLAYLAGTMCFDDNLHGAAQAYYRTAAQLSSGIGDRQRYSMTLRQMSVQAHYVGHPKLALQFAEGAGREISGVQPQFAAFVTGQEAVALAGVGMRQEAFAKLGRVQRLLDRNEAAVSVLGGYHPAAFAHQQAEVLAAVRDIPGACGALAVSLRHRHPEERRARMLTTARLAELQLGQGHLELACTTWEGFLDDYPLISSARGDSALRALRAGLRPYQREPSARRLLARAARLSAPRTGGPAGSA
ncbi:hypothetical protein, partial [Kitasatospora putterlickiae]|uniref:hypothetical protein n=1 Tax=Kitasatospora putterlickiae TaxID=221725 RepID=UPI0031D5ADDD